MTAVPAEPGKVRTLPMLITMACGLFGLVACGGGGGAPDTALPDNALGAAAASPASPADPTPAAISLSYTMESVKAPDGSEARLVAANSFDPVIRNINSRGDFIGFVFGIGNSGFFFFDHARHASLPIDGVLHGVNEAGIVVGTDTSAFTWSTQNGKRHFLSGVAGVTTLGSAISNSGFVAGKICSGDFQDSNICDVYRWDDARSSLTIYPNFALFNMNEAGTLMGLRLNAHPTKASVITIALDGKETFLADDSPNSAGHSNDPLFLADNGDAYVEAAPLPGTTLITKSGSTLLIGRGLVPPISGSVDIASATAFNASSRAVGLDRISSADSEFTAAFSFSRAEGTLEIKISGTATTPQPRGVNKDGIVVGTVPSPDNENMPLHAFVWTPVGGGALLDSLVTNLPNGVHLSSADAIGDGGHIVAQSNQGLVLLTPLQACAPSP
jgi:hypothetical protein